jgi:hypothetical protein
MAAALIAARDLDIVSELRCECSSLMAWMTGSVEYFGVDNLYPYFDALSSRGLSPGRSGVPGLSIGSGEDSRRENPPHPEVEMAPYYPGHSGQSYRNSM